MPVSMFFPVTSSIRQRGTRIKPGLNVDVGKDDTIFATIEGVVVYDVIQGPQTCQCHAGGEITGERIY